MNKVAFKNKFALLIPGQGTGMAMAEASFFVGFDVCFGSLS